MSYGLKNNIQAYGGGTVLLNPGESKPCQLPAYDANNALMGIVYIFNDPTNQRLVLSKNAITQIIRIVITYR